MALHLVGSFDSRVTTVSLVDEEVAHLTVVELPLPAVLQVEDGTTTVEVIGRPATCCVEVVT